MAHRGSGRMAAPHNVASKNARVKLKVHIAAVELKEILNVPKEVDVEMTWEHLFREVYRVPVTSQKYSIKRQGNGIAKHHLSEKIRILMEEFKKIRQVFVVQLVENTKGHPIPAPRQASPTRIGLAQGQDHGQGRRPGPAQSLARGREVPSSPPIQNGHIHGTRQGHRVLKTKAPVKVKLPATKRVPKRELSPSPSSVGTAPVTNRSPQSPSPGNYGRTSNNNSPGNSNKRAGGTPNGGPPQQRPRHSVTFTGLPEELDLSNGAYDRRRQMFDDDAASQCTAGSQESQDDLEAEGVSTDEDFKPLVMRRLFPVTNVQLIKIREELRKIREGPGKMMRFTAKAPLGVAFLRQLFENN